MIQWVSGDLLASKAELLVNPVNVIGVSGAGLAKQFAQRFPLEQNVYKRACRQHQLWIGGGMIVGRVYYFPTKEHWKDPSSLQFIGAGLQEFVRRAGKYRSAAFPQLGCGCGGLNWTDVQPLLVQYLEGLTMQVEVYSPQESLHAPLPVPLRRVQP